MNWNLKLEVFIQFFCMSTSKLKTLLLSHAFILFDGKVSFIQDFSRSLEFRKGNGILGEIYEMDGDL